MVLDYGVVEQRLGPRGWSSPAIWGSGAASFGGRAAERVAASRAGAGQRWSRRRSIPARRAAASSSDGVGRVSAAAAVMAVAGRVGTSAWRLQATRRRELGSDFGHFNTFFACSSSAPLMARPACLTTFCRRGQGGGAQYVCCWRGDILAGRHGRSLSTSTYVSTEITEDIRSRWEDNDTQRRFVEISQHRSFSARAPGGRRHHTEAVTTVAHAVARRGQRSRVLWPRPILGRAQFGGRGRGYGPQGNMYTECVSMYSQKINIMNILCIYDVLSDYLEKQKK